MKIASNLRLITQKAKKHLIKRIALVLTMRADDPAALLRGHTDVVLHLNMTQRPTVDRRNVFHYYRFADVNIGEVCVSSGAQETLVGFTLYWGSVTVQLPACWYASLGGCRSLRFQYLGHASCRLVFPID